MTDAPPMPDHRCLPEFDLAPRQWLKEPDRSVVVCAAPRTGSTWICEELGFRGLGEPLEYLNEVYVHYLSWRWGCTNLAQYRMYLWRTRTSAAGTFGIKVLGMQMARLIDELFAPLLPEPADEIFVRRRQQLEIVAPRPTFIWLRRQDKVEQAVSWWVAARTELWMQKLSRDSRDLSVLDYNFDAIHRFYQRAVDDEASWEQFFTANQIEPQSLTYEDVLQDPDTVLGRLAAQLGGHYAAADVPELRNHIQRNDVTNMFVDRFRSDLHSKSANNSMA